MKAFQQALQAKNYTFRRVRQADIQRMDTTFAFVIFAVVATLITSWLYDL